MPSSVSINKNDIRVSPSEAAQRLCVPLNFENEIIERCSAELYRTVEPKYYCVEFDIDTSKDGVVDFGFAKFGSADLHKNLKGCKKAFIFAVTLGLGVDRLVTTAKISSPSRAFVLDALASATAEAAADCVSAHLREKFSLRPRFSPGYGDFDLGAPRDILNVLNADKILGIKLGSNLLMTPKKTITAVQGVENE